MNLVKCDLCGKEEENGYGKKLVNWWKCNATLSEDVVDEIDLCNVCVKSVLPKSKHLGKT